MKEAHANNGAIRIEQTERYRLRDYRGALMAFTECLQDTNFPLTPGEMGLLYHQIGNCLVKLKNPREAIQAYSQATADTAYRALATVECNLGMAFASLRDYTNAINCFEKSVADTTNPTPYKSYMGMGNALMKLGKSAEAGVAFREAALDESNPDPTKALLKPGARRGLEPFGRRVGLRERSRSSTCSRPRATSCRRAWDRPTWPAARWRRRRRLFEEAISP